MNPPSITHSTYLQRISAEGGFSVWQIGALTSAILLGGEYLYDYRLTAVANIVLGLIVVFGFVTGYKLWLGLKTEGGLVERPEQLLSDEEVPGYIILLPLRYERQVLNQLVAGVMQLDYPAGKLQVFLVIDDDDDLTLAAVRHLDLPSQFQVVVVPASWPGARGKPRSLNYVRYGGDPSINLRGDHLVIYDGEDVPQLDQIRLAATVFAQYPEIACLQAELRWWNADTSWRERKRARMEDGHRTTWLSMVMAMWLTKMIAVSYAVNFRIVLPGLCATRAVIPLGGTSNHFRVSVLEEIGWWDAYNVTEDCDAGIKIARLGGQVRCLPSVTYEEAAETLTAAVKQQSRWTKGYIASSIAHTRNPFRLVKDLGLRRCWSMLVIVMLSPLASVAAPFFWLMTLSYLAFQPTIIGRIITPAALSIGTVCLLANVLFIGLGMFAILATSQYRLWPWTILLPVYWLTVTAAASMIAWKQALTGKLYTWYRTPHIHTAAMLSMPDGHLPVEAVSAAPPGSREEA